MLNGCKNTCFAVNLGRVKYMEIKLDDGGKFEHHYR